MEGLWEQEPEEGAVMKLEADPFEVSGAWGATSQRN